MGDVARWPAVVDRTELETLADVQGFQVYAVTPVARPTWEVACAEAGIPVALSDLALWHAAGLGPRSTLCTIHQGARALVGAFAIHHWPSRALPGHRILRLERFGEAIPAGAEHACIAALMTWARRTPLLLRISVEVQDFDGERRRRIASVLSNTGFHRDASVRRYQRTLLLDLQRDDQSLLASFSAHARQSIRLAERFPLSVTTLQDNSLLPQLEQIYHDTYARTGARPPAQQPWAAVLDAARQHPDRLRLFGVFLTEADQPKLVAFARALRHGTYVEYDAAGSTRLADRRIPLMYPLMWSLIRWARDSGATRLDLGGVSPGTSGDSHDPLSGISEFKRKFRGEEVEVGEDWRLDIAPWRQRIVRSIGKLSNVVRFASR